VAGEPTNTPYGRVATFTDPQGGSFAVLSVSTG
jgi:predicted enzyme related to lactoylglutathione lyase